MVKILAFSINRKHLYVINFFLQLPKGDKGLYIHYQLDSTKFTQQRIQIECFMTHVKVLAQWTIQYRLFHGKGELLVKDAR